MAWFKFAWYLSVLEVNTYIVSGYFKNNWASVTKSVFLERFDKIVPWEYNWGWTGENGRPKKTLKTPIYVPCEKLQWNTMAGCGIHDPQKEIIEAKIPKSVLSELFKMWQKD